ncbi:MAG: hypothetical protein ABIU54_00095 [Candidatus Eisenbacteria bacterium]
MPVSRRRIAICRSLAALPLLAAVLGLRPSAALAEYRVLETEDMRLVYPAPVLSFIAPYTARCFENSMRFHRELWHWRPAQKVNVILDDYTDFGNAGVWAAPRNSMNVHIAPSNSVYETGPANERMNFTMNHEVVHVLALDGQAGTDGLARGLLRGRVRETSEHPETIVYGNLTLPRRGSPRWYHEGIAVFLETWMAGGLGRAQGPYDEMVFRSMVRDDARFYDPLGLEAEGTKVDFQVGVNSYLYGTRFMTYLAYIHGPEKLLQWVGRGEGSKRYFANQFAHVYGRHLSDVWRDWVHFEHAFQQANLDSVRQHPTTAWRDLSSIALGSVSNAFVDSASRSLIAAVYRPGVVAHLARIPLGGGPSQVLHEIKGPAIYFVSSLAFDPVSRGVFYTADHNEWRELCHYDLATGRSRTLIRNARVGDLAFDRTTRALWAVRHFNGISTIVRFDAPYTDWKQVWSLPYGLDVAGLALSPDGATLAASFSEISGRQTLRLLPTAGLATGDTSSRTLWDFGNALPEGFTFTPDGRYLFGSSYYTGVSNIFRYDLARDSMDVVSNAETGFFRPVPMGGDSLIVFRYSGQGFRPTRILPEPLTDVSATRFLGAELVHRHPQLRQWAAPPPSSVHLDSAAMRSYPYRPLASVRLATLYPIVEGYRNATALGWNADFSDPIQFHRFSVSATWTPQKWIAPDQRLHLSARYQRFDMTLAFRLNPASFYDLVGPTKASRKGYGTSVDWHRSLVRDLPRSLNLALRANHWGGLDHLPQHQNVELAPGFDQLLGGGAELRYRNLRASIGAADHEIGHEWWLGANQNAVRFVREGGAHWRGFPSFDTGVDAGHPLPGIRNSSLWLRTAAGWAPGERDEPFANFYFGGFGNNWLDRREPKRYRDPSSFPGTKIDAIAGTNYTRAMLDWNLPAVRFRRAGTLALYASSARVSVFTGALVTNLDDSPTRRRLANIGAQVDVRLQLMTQNPLTMSFGWARAFERDFRSTEEWMASLKVL